jgi:arsenate reductase (thioredoxin)
MMANDRPEILFLCVHNAGRSQMAAAFAREMGGDDVVVHSAGSDPSENLNPAVVEAMEEVGLDISRESPKRLTEEMGRRADVIVTMGCGDACPVYFGKRYEDWELEDPRDKDLNTVRRIRDQIRDRVRALVSELVIGKDGTTNP